ncbi:MAG: long-chain-acyl-CoA synthetase [Candidatus Thorarchaeota archaeon]
MSPNYTEKEAMVYKRFGQAMLSVQQNPNQGLGTFVENLAKEKPNNIALHYKDDFWTWQILNEESNKYSNFFLDQGLNPGETVALMLENCPEYLFCITGINKIQGICALINFNQRRQALTHSFSIVDSKFIIIDGYNLPFFDEIADTLPYKNGNIFIINNHKNIKHNYVDLPKKLISISKSNPPTTNNSILRQTALYIFTSGTTGLPKAVIMQNFKIFTQAYILGSALADLTPEDIIYINTPLYHNFAIGITWPTTLVLGATAVLRKRFSASEFWKDIHKYKITFMIYVGEIPRYLLNQPPSELEKNHTLKKMVGIGLRKEIWEQFKERFKIDHIYEFYGLTEGHRTLFNADEIPGMVGRHSMGGLALAKVDPETGEFFRNERGYCIKCKAGDIGMALFKLEERSFFTGYKDKEKTQNKILHDIFRKNDRYFNTGDMLKLHDDLWVSFADRFGDTFRWKSENVSTTEVESILNSFPAIQMSAVYGVTIPNTEGKAGMAAIKLNPSIKFEIDKFSKFVCDVLPGYSIPIFIRFRDELEITGPYKIKKITLKREAYDIEMIEEDMLFWDSGSKKYVPFTKSVYQKIKDGKFGTLNSKLIIPT